jgi:ethanolamine transporter EutH
VGLLILMVLSILVVWPLWYLATIYTRLYSLGITLLVGVSIVCVIFAKLRKVLGNSSSQGIKTVDAGTQQSGSEEHK